MKPRAAYGAYKRRAGAAAPVNTVPPVIVPSGNFSIGESLITTDGTWTGVGLTYTYQWRRDGVDIPGEIFGSLVLTAADIGPEIDCVVTAYTAGGSASSDSNNLAFTPFGQGDLALDLDAALGVILDGSSKVSDVADQSGNGRNYAQSDSSKRYSMGTLNGQPAFVSNGAVTYLTGPSLSGLAAAHAFFVMQLDAEPPASGAGGFWDFGSDATATHVTFGNAIYDDFGSTTRQATGDPILSLSSSPRLYEVVSRSGEWTNKLDGAVHFTTATNTVGWRAAPSYIGADAANLTGMWMNGKWARLLVFSAKRTATQLADLYAYIEYKYGLTLP